MGEQLETHVMRSSGITLALKWKQHHWGLVLGSAMITAALTALFLVLLYGTAGKTVTLVVDGEETELFTYDRTLERLLARHDVQIGAHDEVSAELQTALQHGLTVTIDRAAPVILTADGLTRTRYTTAKTVAAALNQLEIPMGEEDKVFPLPESELIGGAEIKVVRVTKVIEDVAEPVPFDVVRHADDSLVKGTEQVLQEGQAGLLAKKLEKVYEDGVLVNESVVEQAMALPSINHIVAVGNKNPVVILSAASPNIDQVTKDGFTFGVKQVLNNVTLTAYTAGAESTGKTSDHPQYGLTYTGTRVAEGRTVAVDPKVVPLGWWVYIEGIGLRRAEDIGGAITGNKIDVYYENVDHARRFGIQRGYKVYIIGKDKPVIN